MAEKEKTTELPWARKRENIGAFCIATLAKEMAISCRHVLEWEEAEDGITRFFFGRDAQF